MSLKQLKNVKKYKLKENASHEIEEFINKFEHLDDNLKQEFKKRIEYKSLYIYNKIFEFLTKNKEISPDERYTMTHSIFIYDKRLRKILYEFISFIEERLRSLLLNNFNLSDQDIKQIYEFTFGDLVRSLKKQMSQIDLKLDFDKIESIINLRNQVFHNRLILINVDELVINNDNIEKIQLLYKFLPNNVAEDFAIKIGNIEEKGINYNKYKDNIIFSLPEEMKISKLLKK